MAYQDAFLQFSSYQTVTGASPVLGSYAIDKGAGRDIGQGKSLPIVFRVNSAFSGLSYLECQIVQADDAGLMSNVEVLGSTGPIAVASLTSGAVFVAKPGPLLQGRTARRYIGVQYVPTGLGTAGVISAALEPDISDPMKPSVYGSSGGGFKVL